MIQANNNEYNSTKELQILNFYSDGCLPCHAFMPNFIKAEETYGEHFDFIAVDSSNNIGLFQKFRVRGTPTIIILKGEEVIFNKSGVPNGAELKKIMVDLIGQEPKKKKIIELKKKNFLGLF